MLASAHGGGLDSYGCHHNRKAGGYHCHRGPLAGQEFASKVEMQDALAKREGGASKADAAGEVVGRVVAIADGDTLTILVSLANAHALERSKCSRFSSCSKFDFPGGCVNTEAALEVIERAAKRAAQTARPPDQRNQ